MPPKAAPTMRVRGEDRASTRPVPEGALHARSHSEDMGVYRAADGKGLPTCCPVLRLQPRRLALARMVRSLHSNSDRSGLSVPVKVSLWRAHCDRGTRPINSNVKVGLIGSARASAARPSAHRLRKPTQPAFQNLTPCPRTIRVAMCADVLTG